MNLGPFPVALAIARLRVLVPMLELVGNAADLRTALDAKPNKMPAAYLVAEERGGQIKHTGPVAQQNVDVTLQVVLFVRNAGGERAGTGARAEMDALITQVRGALFGWTPGAAYNALSFVAGKDDLYGSGVLVSQQIFRTDYRLSQQVPA